MTKRCYGFSLVELAVVLAISGVILGFVLKVTGAAGNRDCYAVTQKQIENAREAVERFAIANDRFPMPARRNVGVESPSYGREAVVGDLDLVSGAVFGALPFQALGIASENAADCWGNKLTYVVTQDLTDPAKFVIPATSGAVSINTTNSNVFLGGAGYAIVSHGGDQLGAVKNNYNTVTNNPADRKWCAADATQIRTQNCDVVNNILISTKFNDGKDGAANFFDDVIVYRGKPWRIGKDECECPAGAAPFANLFTVSPTGPTCPTP